MVGIPRGKIFTNHFAKRLHFLIVNQEHPPAPFRETIENGLGLNLTQVALNTEQPPLRGGLCITAITIAPPAKIKENSNRCLLAVAREFQML